MVVLYIVYRDDSISLGCLSLYGWLVIFVGLEYSVC